MEIRPVAHDSLTGQYLVRVKAMSRAIRSWRGYERNLRKDEIVYVADRSFRILAATLLTAIAALNLIADPLRRLASRCHLTKPYGANSSLVHQLARSVQQVFFSLPKAIVFNELPYSDLDASLVDIRRTPEQILEALNQGADPECQPNSTHNLTAFEFAVIRENRAAVSKMLELKIDLKQLHKPRDLFAFPLVTTVLSPPTVWVNAVCLTKKPPGAARYQIIETVAKTHPYLQNSIESPLALAVGDSSYPDNKETVEEFLKQGYDPNTTIKITDRGAISILDYCFMYGYVNTARVLLQYGATMPRSEYLPRVSPEMLEVLLYHFLEKGDQNFLGPFLIKILQSAQTTQVNMITGDHSEIMQVFVPWLEKAWKKHPLREADYVSLRREIDAYMQQIVTGRLEFDAYMQQIVGVCEPAIILLPLMATFFPCDYENFAAEFQRLVVPKFSNNDIARRVQFLRLGLDPNLRANFLNAFPIEWASLKSKKLADSSFKKRVLENFTLPTLIFLSSDKRAKLHAEQTREIEQVEKTSTFKELLLGEILARRKAG